MSWCVSPWVYLVQDSEGFLNVGGYFLSHFREVFVYYLLKYPLMPFPFVFFLDTMIWILGPLMFSLKCLWDYPNFFFCFFFFFFIVLCLSYSHHYIFQLTYLFFCVSYSVSLLCIFNLLLHCLLLIIYYFILLGPC